MQIIFSAPNQVRIDWPAYDAATEAEIVRRLKTVPGLEGFGRRYYAPVIQTARLMELFPKASYDYRALQAADATARTFYESLVCLHVNLEIDASGAICGVGENVSPLIQQLIDERSHALRPLVADALADPKPKSRAMATPLHGPLTKEDAGWERVMTGARNAAKKEEEQAEKFQWQKRRRKVAKKEAA